MSGTADYVLFSAQIRKPGAFNDYPGELVFITMYKKSGAAAAALTPI
jgi:hypothetical protein